MELNNEMVTKHANDWKNVKIIGLSVDPELQSLVHHVELEGWGDVTHYWTGGPNCTAQKDWGVTGIPHCVLINKAGKTVWTGHPAMIDFEEAIPKLLRGQPL